MARKIDLKTVPLSLSNGKDNAVLDYGDMIKTILTVGSPQQGLSLDEVIKAVEALKPLDKALKEHANYVTFSEEQYRTLREKLDRFPFGIADPAIAEFGLMIRNAQEITG